jgi:general secretion pathway protein J
LVGACRYRSIGVRQAGFTLLELLIAMTLMGLVLAMLYGGLRVGMRSWEVGEQRADTVDELRLVQSFIRQRFRQSVTTFHQDESDGRAVAFIGRSDQVRLVTPMLAYLGMGGLYAIQIDTIEEAEVEHLRIRWWPFRPDLFELDRMENEELVEETTLISGVSDIEWSYFGAQEPDRDPEWADRWEARAQRPLLVRLRLSLRQGTWPELVMALPQ